MSVFRTYFSKNDSLIENNLSNNSQNPVSEISYGTVNSEVSRLIFDFDLAPLISRIQEGHINPERIVRHVLHLTNTIQNAQEYVGKRSYSLDLERASSFSLDLFNVSEDWDEGNGYDFVWNDRPDFVYVDEINPSPNQQAVNWYYRKTNVPWTVSGGSYVSGVTQILGTQYFEDGSEDVEIDITDYINSRLATSGVTGTTGFTGASFGLGLKFSDDLEALETLYRQVVGFHVKDTHTFYEPYVETVIDDTIIDDRNYFYLDKDNDLYLYVNVGNSPQNITVNNVDIYDFEDQLVATATGNSIVNVSKGVYRITLNIDSDEYPDAVIFRDIWNLTINGKEFQHEGQFYLISQNNFFTFDNSNQIDLDNYSFYFWGIKQQEKLVAGDYRKVRLTVKELYPNQDGFKPLDVEYRVYTTVGEKYQLDVIPFTPVNRTNSGYEINLDTSWLIPQDYCLELRLKNGTFYETKECLNFTIISTGIKK